MVESVHGLQILVLILVLAFYRFISNQLPASLLNVLIVCKHLNVLIVCKHRARTCEIIEKLLL